MRRARGWAVPLLMAGVALLPSLSRTAEAAPLNPDDFASLGAFPTASGTFFYNTANLTITGPGITTPLQGVLSASGVAVFDFDSINLNANQDFAAAPLDAFTGRLRTRRAARF